MLQPCQLAAIGAAAGRARSHARRLAALWQIANNRSVPTGEVMLEMLRQGAVAIRPDQHFHGVLWRLDGEAAEIIAVGGDPRGLAAQAGPPPAGTFVPIEQTMVLRRRGMSAWDDLRAFEAPSAWVVRTGWRAAISTTFEAVGAQYALTFASLTPATRTFSVEDEDYLDVLASGFVHQLQVAELETSLHVEQERVRQHAERLEALWKIANNPALRDDERVLMMLEQGAESIRPGQGFRGMLGRIAEDDLIVEALKSSPLFTAEAIRVGTAIPIAETVVQEMVAGNIITRSWDDLAVENSSELDHARGLRALVVTRFSAGGAAWVLSFASAEASRIPWGASDRAYVEILAAFFANHVQQRWQFERIQYQQSHDVLTGLLSRSQFRSQAQAAARTNARYAIVLVDIDAFHEINEWRGPMIGDAILVEVGNALRERAAPDEIVGRVGGDVFGIYLPNPRSREAALARARHFADAFRSGFSTGDRDGTDVVARTACIGLAMAPDDGTLVERILANADAALLRAKRCGQASLVAYELGLEVDARRRSGLRNELARALAEDQFTLHYQPHVHTATGEVSGCEALIRWNHPERGLLAPADFIPFAEQSGIITAIDAWVMKNALHAARELAIGRPGFRLFFNLSGRQAGDLALIRSFIAAARAGVPLENIGVELTETDAMRDVEATRHVCRALRRLNVRVAIDDFGTGYSSLSSLKRLPVDIVKIDRNFVSGVLTDVHDQTIAETIFSIARRFGFESLAEGAEQPDQVTWLREHACAYVQGFAICRPLPIDEFKAWLGSWDGGRDGEGTGRHAEASGVIPPAAIGTADAESFSA
jgi:diguanylate cyclase (GGDEF)-like protein